MNGVVLSSLLVLLACFSFLTGVASADVAVHLLVGALFVLLAFAIALNGMQLSLFSPLSLVIGTFALAYGLRPLYLVLADVPLTLAFGHEPTLYPLAMVAVVLLAGTFLLGYFWDPLGVRNSRADLRETERWSRRRVLFALAAMGVLAAVLYSLMVVTSGMTLGEAFLNPVDFRAATVSEGAFYVTGFALITMWSIFWLLAVWWRDRLTSARVVGLAVLFSGLVILTVPFGTRGYLLGPAIGILWMIDRSRAGSRLDVLRLAPLVLGGVLFVGAYGAYRDLNASGVATPDSVATRIREQGVSGLVERVIGRYDAFDFFVWTLGTFPSGSDGFLFGRSVADFALQPIPRSLFPEKPSQTSAYLAGLQLPNYTREWTPEYGLITEAYINFSFAGVAIVGLLFGVVTKTLDGHLERYRARSSAMLLYAPQVLLPMGWLLAGFNSYTSIMFVMTTVALLLLVRFVRSPEPPAVAT